MLSLSGIIAMLMLSMIAGKQTRQVRLAMYLGVVLIALAQVCIVLYDMYTTPWPTTP